jgi:hypothetical protein
VPQLQSVVRNLRGAVSGWPHNVRAYYALAEEFSPDAVVTDFESFAGLFAKRHRLPLVSVDNIHVVDRCRHERDLVRGHERDLRLARRVVHMKVPRACHYVVTPFFYPEIARERTTLVPSILRPAILAARSEPGEHLLVHQTQSGAEELVQALGRSGMRAAPTASGATSRATSPKAASCTGRSARTDSSTTCVRRARSWPAAASRCSARRYTCASPCSRSRSPASSSRC